MLKNRILSLLLLTSSFTISIISEFKMQVKKPKGTVSYATLLLMNEKSEVLLLRRKDASFGNGLYSLPGGKIESGETAIDAVKREAKEEIGVHVDQLKLVHVVDRQGPETEFYVFTFMAEVRQGIPTNCEIHKCDDMHWFAIDQLPDMIPAHRQAVELIQLGVMYSQHGWNI